MEPCSGACMTLTGVDHLLGSVCQQHEMAEARRPAHAKCLTDVDQGKRYPAQV